MKRKSPHPPVRVIKTAKHDDQWHLHRNLAKFAARLNRLPDAAEARKKKNKSAPHHLLGLLF